MSRWFDIGVNLPDKRLPTEPVLMAAEKAGVTAMLLTGTCLAQSEIAFLETQRHRGKLFSTAGFHPHNAKEWGLNSAQELKTLLTNSEVLAVGECGLDFNRNFSEPDIQLSVFEQQLELAAELQLPVFLHERDAFEQQLGLLKKYRRHLVGGVVHCFTGDLAQMQAYLELDLYIGVTGWVCDDKRASELQNAIPDLPLERVMLETDAPYLKPKNIKLPELDQKPKLKSNQPAYLPQIAARVAELMSVEMSVLQEAAWRNTLTLFKPNLPSVTDGIN